jgi:hypothetical protein
MCYIVSPWGAGSRRIERLRVARPLHGAASASAAAQRRPMAPLFPSWTNVVVRAVLPLGLTGIVGGVVFLLGYVRAPYSTGQFDPIEQPVQFDHRHHVRDVGIDCLYCHYAAETSSYAGIPSSSLCMNCHSQIWNGASVLDPVRHSFFSGESISWERVHNLPDFVFFNHSVHVKRGVGCVTCHGRVDKMGVVYATAPLTMQWCLDCHRAPAANIRPLDRITDMEWTPNSDTLGSRLASERGIDPPTQCSGCHR